MPLKSPPMKKRKTRQSDVGNSSVPGGSNEPITNSGATNPQNELPSTTRERKGKTRESRKQQSATTSAQTATAPQVAKQSSLNCWLLGTPILEIFPVTISLTTSVGSFKDFINKTADLQLGPPQVRKLNIWRVSILEDDLEKSLSGCTDPATVDGATVLSPATVLSSAFPNPLPEHLHVIIQAPSTDRDASRMLSETLPGTPPAETRDLWPAVTINATAQGIFGGQAAVEHNRIIELSGNEPDFLQEFRTKLGQQRWIDSNTNPAVLKDVLPEFDNYFQDAPTGVGQGDRVSGKHLLWHLAGAFLHRSWNDITDVKEENVRWILDDLGLYFHSVLGSRARHTFRGNWPFKLIVSVESESEQKKYRYTPRSDFHVSIDRLVHLLVEVQSDKDQSDRYRMLLQAACAARLGRMSYKSPFIVVALYIENTGRVTQYFLFQCDDADPRVSYVSDVQYWTQPHKLFTAIFEIYNLVSIIQSDRRELGSIQERIALLGSDLSKFFKDTFMSKRTQGDTGKDATNPSKRPRASHEGQGGNTGNGLRRGEHVYHDRQVIGEFTRAGYMLESNDEDENGWAPLIQLKPTMRHAIKSNGASVVVKLLYPDSNELQILRHLHQINSPYNHAIPLLRTFELKVGTFILLPEATPLDLGFAIGMFGSEVVDFSQQLIEGVAFLHHRGIAHLDIKPQNIVARLNQLFIIDFDISVRVDGPNALIDRWCGTPGWMAPEIGHQDGPRCSYSPIRADLWSCGLVLRYLASCGAVKEENPFKILTRQLLNKNPQLRPLLYLQSSFRVGHSLSKPQVGMKRKPDRLLHNAKRLAIGTVHP